MNVSYLDYYSRIPTFVAIGNGGILFHLKKRIDNIASDIFSCTCNNQTFTKLFKTFTCMPILFCYNASVITGIVFPRLALSLIEKITHYENADMQLSYRIRLPFIKKRIDKEYNPINNQQSAKDIRIEKALEILKAQNQILFHFYNPRNPFSRIDYTIEEQNRERFWFIVDEIAMEVDSSFLQTVYQKAKKIDAKFVSGTLKAYIDLNASRPILPQEGNWGNYRSSDDKKPYAFALFLDSQQEVDLYNSLEISSLESSADSLDSEASESTQYSEYSYDKEADSEPTSEFSYSGSE